MRRLFEDPELSSELRSDLLRSRAAGQDYPTSAKLLQLRAALGDPARQPLGEPSRLGSLARRAGLRLAHPGWKLLVIAAVGGGAALVAVPASRPASLPQPAAAVSAEAPPTAAESVAPPTAAEKPAPEPQPLEPGSAEPSPARPAAASAGRVKVAQSSRREIAQLVRIRALVERDPAAALRLAAQSEREFPHGVLSEEREGLSIVALARSGSQDAARKRAHAFFSRSPESPMRELVEAALRR